MKIANVVESLDSFTFTFASKPQMKLVLTSNQFLKLFFFFFGGGGEIPHPTPFSLWAFGQQTLELVLPTDI